MRRTVLLALLVALFGLPACGGGGGGGGDSGTALPGTLIPLAVEGTPTPAGAVHPGKLGPVNVANPIMDAAAGGWAAFVTAVNLTAGGVADVLYVAEPNGTLHEVYAVADPVPGGGGATITGFSCVWMCSDGTVYAHAAMSGNPLFGVVSGQVIGGAVTNLAKVVYQNDALSGDMINGVAAIDVTTAQIDGTCTFWYLATLANTGARGLYSSERDGSGNVRHVVTGQNVPPLGTMVAGIDAFGVSWNGVHFGCVLNIGGGVQNVYTSQVGVALLLVAQTGDAMPDSIGTFVDVWKDGEAIYVGPNGRVLFIGIGDQVAPDNALVLMDNNALSDQILARTGEAPNPALSDEYNVLRIIHQRVDLTSFPQYSATLTGGQFSIGTYAFGNGANRYIYDGRAYVGGGNFIGVLPGLSAPKFRSANRDISLAFRDQLDTGATGVFWVFPAQTPLAVALEGGAAPGGDTWGSFAATAHTTANGVVVFTAILTGAGTGMFRRG